MAASSDRGAGSSTAGEAPAGHDAPADPSAAVKQTPVAAIRFDPFDRIYSRESDLTMTEGTGPIHRAAHLILPLGSLPATPNSGIDVQSIRRAPVDGKLQACTDAARRALSPVINDGTLRIRSVSLEPGIPWSGKFYIDVEDLVTGKTKKLEGGVR